MPNKGKSIDLSISESMRREALAKPAFTYPQGKALETAQRNAAKPVSEGGLGLPANNTPMDRAKAMGFDRYDRFPGRNKELPRNQDERLWLRYGDIPEDGISRHIQNGNPEAGVSVMAPLDELSDTSWSPQMLFSMTAGEMGKRPLQVVSGNKVKAGGVFDGMGSDGEPIIKNAKKIRDATDWERYSLVRDMENAADSLGFPKVSGMTRLLDAEKPNYSDVFMTTPQGKLRSRFAAFDPARRNESDLLGRIDPQLLNILAAGGLLGAGYSARQDK